MLKSLQIKSQQDLRYVFYFYFNVVGMQIAPVTIIK